MVAQKPTLDYFSGDENLGLIYREQQQINVKLMNANLPLTNTGGYIAANFGGKIRLLVIQAAHDGTGFAGATPNAQLAAFISRIEAWVNNTITTAETFTDSFGNQYNVIPTDFSWERTNKDSNRIVYTLVMVQTASS